jgi:hypothetical protein
VLAEATKILSTLGVTLNAEKTRIVHVTQGFEFLGYKIKRCMVGLAALGPPYRLRPSNRHTPSPARAYFCQSQPP